MRLFVGTGIGADALTVGHGGGRRQGSGGNGRAGESKSLAWGNNYQPDPIHVFRNSPQYSHDHSSKLPINKINN